MIEQTTQRRAMSLEQAVEERLDAVLLWLKENAPAVAAEQSHLDSGTAERAYYHFGYAAALQDIKDCLPGRNDRVS